MEWTKGKLPQVKDKQIIVATWDKKMKGYRYAVVFYHEPLEVWYGGPGIRMSGKDIEFWADIPAPKSR